MNLPLLIICLIVSFGTAATVIVVVYKDRKARNLPFLEPWHW